MRVWRAYIADSLRKGPPLGRARVATGQSWDGVQRENLPIVEKLENWQSAILRFDFRLSVPQFFSCAAGPVPEKN